MSMKINAAAKLQIATTPEGATDTDKNYKDVCLSTSITSNISINKTDKTYFCNGGATTSVNTGMTASLSVSLDYDPAEESHKYLFDLLQSSYADFSKLNGQYIKVIYPQYEGETAPATLSGKCCIQFKNNIPSGAANELIKLEFDVFPQDKNFEYTAATK